MEGNDAVILVKAEGPAFLFLRKRRGEEVGRVGPPAPNYYVPSLGYMLFPRGFPMTEAIDFFCLIQS